MRLAHAMGCDLGCDLHEAKKMPPFRMALLHSVDLEVKSNP